MERFFRVKPWLGTAAVIVVLVTLNSPPKASQLQRVQELPDIVFVQAATVAGGSLPGRFPQGSRLVRLAKGSPSVSPINLTPEFFAVADPRVSFDGTRVLFVGQSKPEGRWQIWEMKADGAGQHQLFECPGDCFQPAYLPRGQVVFTVVAGGSEHQTSNVYVGQSDGTAAHRITFGPGNFQVETVLRDGRILISAESPLIPGPRAKSRRTRFFINPDGTGLTAFPASQGDSAGAEELADGTLLFVGRENPAASLGSGELAMVSPGTLQSSLLARSSSNFWSAHQLDGNALVVSKKSAPSPHSRERYDLFTFDLESRTFGPLIYHDPSFSSVEAVALEPSSPPKYYWSILHSESKTGRMICLNVRLSSDALRERPAAGVTRVRVLSLDQTQARQEVLGEAPVESDGSFYLSVPADRPVRFELINDKGSVTRAQESWIWVRPGEDRACLGCHANPALTPANHWALALKRASGPTVLGSKEETMPAHH